MSPGAFKTVFVSFIVSVIIVIPAGCDKNNAAVIEIPKRSFEIKYNVKVEDIPADAKEIKVWIPVPVDRQAQKMHYFHVSKEVPYTILEESKYDNNYIYFELHKESFQMLRNEGLEVAFGVTRYQERPLERSWRQYQPESEDHIKIYLTPNSLVPVNGPIAEEAKRVAGHLRGQFAKSKVLYEHIVRTVKYDKRGSGWGRGDALYACDVRKGNCTDFHSLFIGELRSLGIPARFTIGFSIPRDKTEGEIDYHCWAQFYIDGKGWLPVDASQASKNPEKLADYFAEVDENRVAFTVGRDIKLPGSSCEPSNFSIYPCIEIDKKICRNSKTTISFKAIETPQDGLAKNLLNGF